MNDSQLLDIISQILYSTRETQYSSYELGKYVVENDIEGDISGDGFQEINAALDNAFRYKTSEESNKQKDAEIKK